MYILNKREADLCSWSLKQVMTMYSDDIIDEEMRKVMQTAINKLELFKSTDDEEIEEE